MNFAQINETSELMNRFLTLKEETDLFVYAL